MTTFQRSKSVELHDICLVVLTIYIIISVLKVEAEGFSYMFVSIKLHGVMPSKLAQGMRTCEFWRWILSVGRTLTTYSDILRHVACFLQAFSESQLKLECRNVLPHTFQSIIRRHPINLRCIQLQSASLNNLQARRFTSQKTVVFYVDLVLSVPARLPSWDQQNCDVREPGASQASTDVNSHFKLENVIPKTCSPAPPSPTQSRLELSN